MATLFHKVVEEMHHLNLEEKEQVKELTEKMIIDYSSTFEKTFHPHKPALIKLN